ncbi:peptidoglycan-binding domain-containing protein [Alteriqipengyuania lutimaris]|uniref:Peptidoglycan-binding protein n=1 Tax=Alteriqipengyuania lutimaris TaxID=1538146 RepID=A0A395LGU5_9SPHN|nr:peptidoglycan-binding domain-containing protein [Alteriqipengyuania lutimaris]MBB3035267.1 hypothetical protein [Alteriqipengyuania lutimaris]RDS75861.1 peptidoglycan-binding protein [Alteriqipengyuania lutimaris]
MSEIKLTGDHIQALARRNNFRPEAGQYIFFGLRGILPVDIGGTDFASSHRVRLTDINHRYMRCTLGQFDTQSGKIAVFPGSTVPHINYIASAQRRGGIGANMLMLGHFTYKRGVHKPGKSGGHRAFRQASFFPAWRSADDYDFDLDDEVDNDGGYVWDNLHCAYNDNIDVPKFASAGCQVVCGRQESPEGKKNETGPWRKFVANAYGASSAQKTYSYCLFNGAELLLLDVRKPSDISQSIRFGSSGPLAQKAQAALRKAGLPLGEPDGEFGRNSLDALLAFQTREFGPGTADGIIGPNTAARLGLKLPTLAEA